MTRQRLGDLLACLVLVGLALGCFARLARRPDALIVDGERPSIDNMTVGEDRPVGNDLTFLFLPHYLSVSEGFTRTGRLPMWDVAGFAGRPMIGNPQAGLFYPPVWLAWTWKSPAALGWLTVAHILWAGIGAYVLARGVGLGRLAATVAAGCFQASPFLLAQTFEGHYPHVWAACWYPWAYWAYYRHRTGQLRGSFALPPILAMAFLTGHPQEWYYLVFALSAWALVDAVLAARKESPRRGLLTLARWAVLAGLSLGLVAVEFIPDAAAQAWTLRSGSLSFGQVSKYNPHSVNLFQLLSPDALGGPSDYFGHENYWEAQLSVGLVPLVLGIIAVARSSKRRQVNGWLALTAAAAVFAGGRRLGVFTILYGIVPGMNKFRVPSRSLFLTTLGAAILAGLGVEALQRLAGSVEDWRALERRFRQVTLLVLGALLIGEVVGWRSDAFEGSRPSQAVDSSDGRSAVKSEKRNTGDESSAPKVAKLNLENMFIEIEDAEPYRSLLASSRILRDGVFWCTLGAMTAALAYGCLRSGRRRTAAWTLGLLALVELGIHGYAILKVAPVSRFTGPDPISSALADASQSAAHPFRIRVRDVMYPDLRAHIHGFEKININDWFQLQHAAELYQQLYPLFKRVAPPSATDRMGIALRQFGGEIRQRVLDRLGIAFLVSDHLEPDVDWDIVRTGTWNESPYVVYRNPTAMPRTYVVPRAYPTKSFAPKELALFRQIAPREAVLMPRDPLGDEPRRQPFTPAEWVETNDPDRVVIRVTTQAPGLLVVGDTWMPGWTASVDGHRVPVLRGNHALRVVPLFEPGRHEIVMRYWPKGLTRGLAITAGSIFLWGSALSWMLIRRTRTPRGTAAASASAAASSPFPAPHLDLATEGMRTQHKDTKLRNDFKTAAEGGQSHFAPKTPQNRDSPRPF